MAVYDRIANLFHESYTDEFLYTNVDNYSFFNMLGRVTDKSILDLGCGSGAFTRMLKPNAKRLVGVDISEKMIEIAKQEEAREPLGIEYLVGDVFELGEIGRFDLVVASFFLNQAKTKEELLKACQTIYINLKPGGRFITMNNNVDMSPEAYPKWQKYGLTRSVSEPLREGTPITMSFTVNGQPFTFDNYCLSKDTYNWAFQKAGFREIHWHEPMIPPQNIEEFGAEFWQDALDYPMNDYIECLK